MRVGMVDFWNIDPMPTPPAGLDPGSTEYWRWWSAETIKARKQAESASAERDKPEGGRS